jgi:hypothetical protein
MKSAKREWALIAAYILYNIFVYSQYAFMMGTAVNPQRISQTHISTTVGMVLGAFLLPLLLPMGDLRERHRIGGSRPSRYTLRLVLVGLFFIPNIIIRLLGPQAWLANTFNYRVMSIGNGVVSTLMFGCFFTLTGKYRVFWVALALSMGPFLFHLVLGSCQELLPYMFASAGIALTAAGVLLLVFLADVGVPAGLPIENRPIPQNEASGILYAKANAGRGSSLSCILPILAALVIFWTNSLADKLFYR